MKEWTLHIENFGKIEKATIDVNQMMLFVGDNNSGKSYLMSLLWGFQSEAVSLLFDGIENMIEQYAKVGKAWVRENLIWKDLDDKCFLKDDTQVFLEKPVFDEMTELFNRLLEKNKDRFVSSIFNFDIGIRKMEMSLLYRKLEIRVKNIVSDKDFGLLRVEIDGRSHTRIVRLDREENLIIELIRTIMYLVINVRINFGKLYRNTVFLPASRTGFLLSKNMIIRQVLSQQLNPEVEREFSDLESRSNYFTKPVISFIQLLNDIGESHKERKIDYSSVIEMIEKQMIYGSVRWDENVKAEQYKCKDMEKEFGMSVVSSVITEMTPLYLLLKYSREIGILMIEEPEICLHPKYQVIIARVLVQLLNMGIPIWMTTHSDILMQHINNMIKLEQLSATKKEELFKKYSYAEEDLLEGEKVSVYQFTLQEGKTIVEEVERGRDGFDVPSFTDSLRWILEQSYDMAEDENDCQ